MSPERPSSTDPKAETPPHKGVGASKAEHAVRHAPESAVAPHEKRTIGAETSREEDA